MAAHSSGAAPLRATDDDRTAAITALDSALDSGQLDRFEHYERIRVANTARFVDELRPLLADLQGVSIALPGDHSTSGNATVSPSSSPPPGNRRTTNLTPDQIRAIKVPTSSSRTAVIAVVATLIAVGTIGTVGFGVWSAVRETTAVAADQGATSNVHADNEPPLARSTEDMEHIFRTAAEATGSSDVTRLVVHHRHAMVYWPDPEHPTLVHRMAYHGEWQPNGDSPSTGEATFRLDHLDARMLAPIIDSAPATLGIDDATSIVVFTTADDAGLPQYAIAVSNDVHQQGRIVVDSAGTVLGFTEP